MSTNTAHHGTWQQSQAAFAIESRICGAIADVAQGDSPVLIAGERGVGKSAIAAEIHRQSRHAREEYVQISAAECDAPRLVAALSAPGTIYISEVAELSSSLQHLISAHYFRGKGLQGRLLCGTSVELLEQVRSHRMREDFCHLISTVTLRVSPLRFRKADILPIAERLLTQYASQFDRPRPTLGREAGEYLLGHSWPGNLTELEAAIKAFVVLGDTSISLLALKSASDESRQATLHRPVSLKKAARAASTEVERQLISEVLVATGGNRKRAAYELGISYKALLYKLKQVQAESKASLFESGQER